MSNKRIINVLETFSGIGAQNKAIKIVNKKFGKFFKIVATSDWDARANIAYAAMHLELENKYRDTLKKNNLLNEEQINNFLKKYTISLNSKTKSKILMKPLEFKEYLCASIILANNQVDITKLDPKIIEELNINLITYSFPCQGLSIASMGRAKGIIDNDSTSSLIWEIYRMLENSNKKPNYLLMENVKNLLSKKFIDQYEKWKVVLESFGYKTFTVVINGISTGSIQKRERVFALSVLKNIKLPFSNDKEFEIYITKHMKNKKNNEKEDEEIFKKIFNFDLDNYENIEALINNTPSRVKMISRSKIISSENKKYLINTLTTKQDRIPNTGIIEHYNHMENKLGYRFITPREAYKLMGFEDDDFDRLRPLYLKQILTKESLYRQAGNSILVQAIQNLFEIIVEIEKLNGDGE